MSLIQAWMVAYSAELVVKRTTDVIAGNGHAAFAVGQSRSRLLLVLVGMFELSITGGELAVIEP